MRKTLEEQVARYMPMSKAQAEAKAGRDAQRKADEGAQLAARREEGQRARGEAERKALKKARQKAKKLAERMVNEEEAAPNKSEAVVKAGEVDETTAKLKVELTTKSDEWSKTWDALSSPAAQSTDLSDMGDNRFAVLASTSSRVSDNLPYESYPRGVKTAGLEQGDRLAGSPELWSYIPSRWGAPEDPRDRFYDSDEFHWDEPNSSWVAYRATRGRGSNIRNRGSLRNRMLLPDWRSMDPPLAPPLSAASPDIFHDTHHFPDLISPGPSLPVPTDTERIRLAKEREQNERQEWERGEVERKAQWEARKKLEAERRKETKQWEKEAKRREREEAERQAKEKKERIAKKEEERRLKEEEERKAKEEEERKAKEGEELRMKEKAERKARVREEVIARRQAKRKEKEERDAQLKSEAEAKVRAEAEHKAREEEECRVREAEERQLKEETERKARLKVEAEANARAEEEARKKREAEHRAKEEAERKAKEEERVRLRAETEAKARDEAALKAKLEAEREAREKEERRIRDEKVRKAKEEERRLKDEAERQAQEERKAKEEEERRLKEAERKAREAEEARLKAEEEAKAKAEEEARLKEEAERKAKEEAERRAKEEEKTRLKAKAEAKARDEAKAKAKAKADAEAAEATAKANEEAEALRTPSPSASPRHTNNLLRSIIPSYPSPPSFAGDPNPDSNANDIPGQLGTLPPPLLDDIGPEPRERDTSCPTSTHDEDRQPAGPSGLGSTSRGGQATPTTQSVWPGGAEDNVPPISHPLEPVAPLKVSEKRWVGGSMQGTQQKIQDLLNKLTADNFDWTSHRIIRYANRSEQVNDGSMLMHVVKLVFASARDSSMYAGMYARLCHKMTESLSPNIQDDTTQDWDEQATTGGMLFRKYLFNLCQAEFQRGWDVKGTELAVASRARRRGLGLVRFMGELFRLQMLTERTVHGCIKKLLSDVADPKEEDIESLCELLKIVGGALDSPKARSQMDTYFERMKGVVNRSNLNWRIRFMLLDVLELRAGQWQARPPRN